MVSSSLRMFRSSMMVMVAVLVYLLFSASVTVAQGPPAEDTGLDPLAMFSSFAGSQEPGFVILSWVAPNDPTIQGYRVHLGFNTHQYILHTTVGNVTSFEMALPRGFFWYIAVTAYNDWGESPYSEEVVGQLPLLQ